MEIDSQNIKIQLQTGQEICTSSKILHTSDCQQTSPIGKKQKDVKFEYSTSIYLARHHNLITRLQCLARKKPHIDVRILTKFHQTGPDRLFHHLVQ